MSGSNTNALAECYESLARGLQAGIGIPESLRIAASDAPESLAKQLNKAATQVAGGEVLAFALRDRRIASPFDIALLTVGEKTGRLEAVLSTLAARHRRTAERLRRVKGKLLMPLFVLAGGLIVAPLPALTADTIGAGGYLLRVMIPAALIAIAVFAARFIARHTMRIESAALGDQLARIPLLGSLVGAYSRAEFLERLSLFEQSGYPIIDAAEHTAQSMPAFLAMHGYQTVGSDLRYGMLVANTLQRHGVLDEHGFALASSGEQAGQLAGLLQRVADDARKRFDRRLEFIVTWAPRVVYGLVVIYVLRVVL